MHVLHTQKIKLKKFLTRFLIKMTQCEHALVYFFGGTGLHTCQTSVLPLEPCLSVPYLPQTHNNER
jgi:hypothetical protein